jgi:hypothetical protein
MATRTVEFSAGVGLALGSVPWNTSNAKRQKVPWLPNANVKFLNPDGTVSRTWYLALHELFENRMGGVQGQSVAQVATTVTQTQTLVTAATGKVAETIAYARSIDDRASALVQVATDNALTGTSSVPPPSTPPSGTIEP